MPSVYGDTETEAAAPEWTDPVYDPAEPTITPALPDLPQPPEHAEEPAEGEPPAPEPVA